MKILLLIHLLIVIYIIMNVAKSRENTGTKVLWYLIVFLFPYAGPIAWYFLGPRKLA